MANARNVTLRAANACSRIAGRDPGATPEAK
jgi:hypothetical protein